MRIRAFIWLAPLTSCSLFSSVACAAEEAKPSISVDGFIRADYGNGDRYSQARGEDRLGVSKAALGITATYEDIQGVFVAGTERLTDGNSDNDGNIDIKDAYIVVGAGKETGFSFSAGAQALLFGLKPNGYPGDRSLQPSIEYGGAGAFAVSQQAGPSIIGNYKFSPKLSLRFGAFDLDADNATGIAPPTDGSELTDNLFVLARGEDLIIPGLYAAAGVESIYVGGAINDSQMIFSAGVGYKLGIFGASLEFVQLDGEIVGVTDNEQYVVAEFTVLPNSEWTVYADYSMADELDADTLRVGASYQLRKYLGLSFEYSQDSFDRTGATDVDSVDVRLTFTY